MAEIVVSGKVQTTPRSIVTAQGTVIASFRLEENTADIDNPINAFTVVGFGETADLISSTVKKGERIIVSGALRVRSWEAGGASGVNAEIVAKIIL
jgi:single-strand DNA-binding protein